MSELLNVVKVSQYIHTCCLRASDSISSLLFAVVGIFVMSSYGIKS